METNMKTQEEKEKECKCKVPNPVIKNSENGIHVYCSKCAKSL